MFIFFFFFLLCVTFFFFFFFSSRRRHTRWNCDWSSDVCSSDLAEGHGDQGALPHPAGELVRVASSVRVREPDAAEQLEGHRARLPAVERLVRAHRLRD